MNLLKTETKIGILKKKAVVLIVCAVVFVAGCKKNSTNTDEIDKLPVILSSIIYSDSLTNHYREDFVYDSLNNLTKQLITYRPNSPLANYSVSFSYNGKSIISNVYDVNGQIIPRYRTTYTVDDGKRIRLNTHIDPYMKERKFEYVYNGQGKIQELRIYHFDTLNFLREYHYSLSERLDSISLSRFYNNQLRKAGVTIFEYDKRKNRISDWFLISESGRAYMGIPGYYGKPQQLVLNKEANWLVNADGVRWLNEVYVHTNQFDKSGKLVSRSTKIQGYTFGNNTPIIQINRTYTFLYR